MQLIAGGKFNVFKIILQRNLCMMNKKKIPIKLEQE